MNRELIQTSAFVCSAKRLKKRNRVAFTALGETLAILQSDAFDPRLRTHKLRGDLAGLWASSGG